ncbi:hypothetical protein CEXT_55441, partial [Caerostris extrusa]
MPKSRRGANQTPEQKQTLCTRNYCDLAGRIGRYQRPKLLKNQTGISDPSRSYSRETTDYDKFALLRSDIVALGHHMDSGDSWIEKEILLLKQLRQDVDEIEVDCKNLQWASKLIVE